MFLTAINVVIIVVENVFKSHLFNNITNFIENEVFEYEPEDIYLGDSLEEIYIDKLSPYDYC